RDNLEETLGRNRADFAQLILKLRKSRSCETGVSRCVSVRRSASVGPASSFFFQSSFLPYLAGLLLRALGIGTPAAIRSSIRAAGWFALQESIGMVSKLRTRSSMVSVRVITIRYDIPI